MNSSTNPFKSILRAKKPLYGLWAGLADTTCLEICANAGFDWICIDGEHGPNTLRTVLLQLQVLRGLPVFPVVRPVSHEAALLKQYLDIGATNLLIPMVEDAATAAEIVRSIQYPPKGIRGVGTALARAADWGQNSEYLTTADQNLSLLLQIESKKALGQVTQIAATEGVDGLFVGPADLAASMGRPGEPNHPDVQEAISRIIQQTLEAGKTIGIMATDPALARSYRDQGVTLLGVGVDTVILARGSKECVDNFQ